MDRWEARGRWRSVRRWGWKRWGSVRRRARGRGRARSLFRVTVPLTARHMFLVFAVAGAILLLDQTLRPVAQAWLTGARIPFLGGRIVLERLDDPATTATLAALRFHLTVALGAIVLMAILSRFMGWYGMALLAGFGLVLGGAESNHVSMLAYGFVLNWIGYRIDGPVFVVAPADLMQMAGLAIIASSLTLFTAATVGELVPTRVPDSDRPLLARPALEASASSDAPGRPASHGWNGRAMIAAR